MRDASRAATPERQARRLARVRGRDRLRGRGADPGGGHLAGGRVRPVGRDESGGAISLWVVLMVPVSAFAAVVAMAGPQRLAAESSVQEAADDLAVFAVAWRDGHQLKEGPLPAFFTQCDQMSVKHQADLDRLQLDLDMLNADLDDLVNVLNLPPTDPRVIAKQQEVADKVTESAGRELEIHEWSASCVQLFEALVRDLGYLGVDFGSLRGSYSDSLQMSALVGNCSNPLYPTEAACTTAGETWTWTPGFELPCWTGQTVVVQDAVHVVLAANWQDAGWAAAQVWPDGIPMAAESTGRFTQRNTGGSPPPLCQRQLVVLDSQGRPAWSGSDPGPDSRELAQSVRRTTLSG